MSCPEESVCQRFTVMAIPEKFTSMCKDGESGAAGLPDENALYDMVMRYSA